MQPTLDGRPEPTGRFQDVNYPGNVEDRGPQFEIAVRFSEPVDQGWLSIFRQQPDARSVSWDEEKSEISTLTVWAPTSDVTPIMNGISRAISKTNEKYSRIEKLTPKLEAELDLWWQRL